MEKQFSLLKPNAAQIALPTTSQKLAYLSVPCTVVSHKQCALAHSNYLKNKKTQPSSQLTSQPAVSTSMASLSLSTLMHQQITKIIYTAQAAQRVPAKLVE
jgi:hypothetical protein